jgi:hypothetical protein
MEFQMILLLTIGLSERPGWGREAFGEVCSGEKRYFRTNPQALLPTTIQETGLLGNNISFAKHKTVFGDRDCGGIIARAFGRHMRGGPLQCAGSMVSTVFIARSPQFAQRATSYPVSRDMYAIIATDATIHTGGLQDETEIRGCRTRNTIDVVRMRYEVGLCGKAC